MSTKFLTMVTASGEQHGMINRMPNQVPFDGFKNFAPEHKAKLEKEMKEDNRVVKAEYINSNGRSERLEKKYCKYPGDDIQEWRFIPGFTYQVPYGLVKEVNESNDKLVQRADLVSLDGDLVQQDGRPLSKDRSAPWVHKFVAAGFSA
jgi:hypothetical protein